jgi:hypothetical protein
VSIWAFEALDEVASGGIPDSNTLVERSSSNELGVWRDGDSGDTIFDAEGENILAGLDVPKSDGAITATGSDGATVTSEVQRVDILLMASKGIPDGPSGNVPNSN